MLLEWQASRVGALPSGGPVCPTLVLTSIITVLSAVADSTARMGNCVHVLLPLCIHAAKQSGAACIRWDQTLCAHKDQIFKAIILPNMPMGD